MSLSACFSIFLSLFFSSSPPSLFSLCLSLPFCPSLPPLCGKPSCWTCRTINKVLPVKERLTDCSFCKRGHAYFFKVSMALLKALTHFGGWCWPILGPPRHTQSQRLINNVQCLGHWLITQWSISETQNTSYSSVTLDCEMATDFELLACLKDLEIPMHSRLDPQVFSGRWGFVICFPS